jgi:hypothetical protein
MEKVNPLRPTRFYDRFAMLFILVAFTIALLLLVDLASVASGWSEVLSILVTLLTGLMLLVAVSASGAQHRVVVAARVIVASTVVAASISAFLDAQSATVGVVWVLLIIAAPLLVLRRILEHTEVTSETLFGAVSVYLLTAVAGTYVFLLIQAWSRSDFFGTDEPTTSFMYFSLVTIATLGYGDIAPATEIPRAASVTLAVAGQMYLVVVVARLVSLYSRPRSNAKTRPRRGDDTTADEGD